MSDRRSLLICHLANLKEKGGAQVTVTDLAKAAGISRSSLYKYYPDVLSLLSTSTDNIQRSAFDGAGKKQDMLRNQLKKHKDLVACLSNICSNQLVEIAELNERIAYLERTSEAKIAFLTAQIASSERKSLRTVK
jgi:AcrR family transcriptional regulator